MLQWKKGPRFSKRIKQYVPIISSCDPSTYTKINKKVKGIIVKKKKTFKHNPKLFGKYKIDIIKYESWKKIIKSLTWDKIVSKISTILINKISQKIIKNEKNLQKLSVEHQNRLKRLLLANINRLDSAYLNHVLL